MIEIIQDIIEEKLKRNKSPAHALYREIIKKANECGIETKQANKELRELLDSGKIKVGKTLNDNWIITNELH